MCEDIHSWTKSTPQASPGCGNLVRASPHTASGETSVRDSWVVAERDNSVGICLAN